ncbi:hypothetical protein BDW68DRAFT_87599 [Aspergillus falconensis]
MSLSGVRQTAERYSSRSSNRGLESRPKLRKPTDSASGFLIGRSRAISIKSIFTGLGYLLLPITHAVYYVAHRTLSPMEQAATKARF